VSVVCAALALVGSLSARTAAAQGRPRALAATRASSAELRAWDQEIDRMLRARDLRLREAIRDAALPDRRHERLDQYHRGLRIVGGDLTRQTAADGTVSVFGVLHGEVALNVSPDIPGAEAAAAIERAVGGAAFGSVAELVILPLSDGYHLAYYGQALVGLEIVNVYVDANSGALLQQYSDFMREVGLGKGAYGDDKKVSAKAVGGAFVTDDPLRPSAITTYDMRGNLSRLNLILNRATSVAPSDIATDSDNQWTDPTVVDAHVYAGWYYDYLFKRFGRRGLDDRELRMAVFTHPVRLQDIAGAATDVVGMYYLNAFSCSTCGPDGRGAILLGEGAPRGFLGNYEVKPFGSALDVVAHELTHSVTATSARLNGFPFSEAGSLNEGFSDVFGAATAFFHLPPGNGPMQASYVGGKDLTVPSGFLGRSLSNPTSMRSIDHYTQRNIGGDPHANGTIAGHAFYLAIEGGTHRLSGITVQGVGAGNREQIEKSFFRALTMLMPSNATFAVARIATIQAARDLYGAGSASERAITQAWDAVGVQERSSPTAALLPNPAAGTRNTCGGISPSWILGITVSAGSSSLRITQWQIENFDSTGASVEREVLSPSTFSSFFNQCGPGSATILAQTDACSAVCTSLGNGLASGSTQVTFTALDDAGRVMTFATPRAILVAPR